MAGEVRYYRKAESAPLIAQSVQDDLETAGDEIEKSIYEVGQSEAFAVGGVVLPRRSHSHTPGPAGLLHRETDQRHTFENFTEVDDGGLMYPSSVELPGVQEVGWMVEDGNGTDGTGGSDCNQWTCLNDFIFALLLLVNMGFCAFFCYDGILRERPFEMIGYAVGIFLVGLYIIIDYALEGNQGDITRLVRLVLVILMAPQNIVLAIVVQHKMGYRVLRAIGSNKSLTKVYHCRSLFLVIQRFNLQVLSNVLVLSWAKNGNFTGLSEKIAVPLLIAIMVLVAFMGWLAVTWESMPLSVVWCFLALPSGGFYVFKMVNVAVRWEVYERVYREYYDNGSSPDEAYFTIDASAILFLCGIGLLCIVSMCALMYVVVKNFGKGLKERLPPPCSSCVKKDHNYYLN